MSFMDGVPVKISEKYKPPPKVTIPQAVINRLNSPRNYTEEVQFNYDFTLEKCVVTKINEWKRVRDVEKENRRDRIRKYEIEKARRLEEQQKQLLTDVSYPSAEELSSDDEDGKDVKAAAVSEESNKVQLASSQMNFNTILMPTIIPTACSATHPALLTANSDLNYSDFENIESSPFDNIELKTINDLDILAQVLNVTHLHSNNKEHNRVSNAQEDQTLTEVQKSSVATTEKQQQQSVDNGECRSSYVGAKNYVNTDEQLTDHRNQTFMAAVNYNHQASDGSQSTYTNYYNYNNLPINNQNCLYSNNYQIYQHQQQQQLGYNQYTTNYCNGQHYSLMGATSTEEPMDDAILATKSKSKSVPDILKELNSEILHSEARRARNHSQNLDDKVLVENSVENDDNRVSVVQNDCFIKLSTSSQNLVKNISLMGFPLERVSKIANRIGNDDKKIIEHLIPLSELLDLGFDETKISDALLKFENNKEKALDFLIS